MSEVLVLRPDDFTGFDNTSIASLNQVDYYSGNANRHVYVLRATIAATATTRTISSVTARFVGPTSSSTRYVVCQISSGANDFINTVGASGSSAGRSVKTIITGSGYTNLGNGFGGYTFSFDFATEITLAKNTTYYLWFYPDASSSVSSIGLMIDPDSGATYWSVAGATLNGTEISTPISVSVSASPYNSNSTVNGWGVYLQGYSQANITVTATGTNDSTITSCVTYLGSTRVWNSSATSGRSAVISGSGNITITATVTDATGASATATTTISVLAYQTPNITNITSYRCNNSGTANTNGTYLWFSGTPTYSSVNGNNSCTVSFKYGPVDGTMGSYSTISNPSTWQQIVSGLSTTTSYNVVFRVTDTLGNTREFSKTIPSAAVTMNFKDGGTGVCLGGYATKDNCFEIANAQGWKGIISNGMYGDTLPSSGSEGQIFFLSAQNQSGSANMDFAMYNSVTDVGQTSGSAIIGDTFLAMPDCSILICDAGQFDSSEVPTIYGTIELVRYSSYRGWVLLYGKDTGATDYRKSIFYDGLNKPWYKITMTQV